jgi:polyhydroxybutyrate depolymerase
MRAILSCLLSACAAAADPLPLSPGQTVSDTVVHDRLDRLVLIHAPANPPGGRLPLVLVLHGGTGTAAGTEGFTAFDAIAEREGFIAAYPQGTSVAGKKGFYWNDDRDGSTSSSTEADDVGFIAEVVDRLAAQGAVDRARVFATGISNGAMMCHRLGREIPGRIAAIAPVAGNLPLTTPMPLAPRRTVAVAMFSGTDDSFMPYGGGEITFFGVPLHPTIGLVLSAPDTVAAWVAADQAAPTPAIDAHYGAHRLDGCDVTRYRYPAAAPGADVWFYRIEGGGHTWPGSTASGMAVLGRVCRDIDASEEIWAFFKTHGR